MTSSAHKHKGRNRCVTPCGTCWNGVSATIGHFTPRNCPRFFVTGPASIQKIFSIAGCSPWTVDKFLVVANKPELKPGGNASGDAAIGTTQDENQVVRERNTGAGNDHPVKPLEA